MLYETTMASPIGPLRLIASDTGLRAVLWPDDDLGRIHLNESTIVNSGHPILTASMTQLNEYFDGTRTGFDLPLDLQGTDFQQACWRALATIPYGSTASYREQAEMIGRPTAVRAVGGANARNPLSIVLPCHRVIASSGALTGFAGGLDTKKWLLDFESAQNSSGREI